GAPWRPFEDGGVGGEAWARGVLRNAQPGLSLRGLPDAATCNALAKAQGRGVRTVHEAPEDIPPPLLGGDSEEDGAVTRGIALRYQFEALLNEVRYPPSALQCSWRLPPAGHPVPEDLVDDVPPRPFELRSNADSAPAPQPPHFAQHPLRPEQLKSLGWMLEQECGRGLGPFQVEWRRYWTTKPEEIDENACMSLVSRGMRVSITPARCLKNSPQEKTVYREVCGHCLVAFW
ncbi:unnamed protein product, partial [Prorocentrum cordatum]